MRPGFRSRSALVPTAPACPWSSPTVRLPGAHSAFSNRSPSHITPHFHVANRCPAPRARSDAGCPTSCVATAQATHSAAARSVFRRQRCRWKDTAAAYCAGAPAPHGAE